jgi:hypothetical protein
MWFGTVKLGRGYVSFHLSPLYILPALEKEISPILKKRMEGKTCFNFETIPNAELIVDLRRLTAAAAAEWDRYLRPGGSSLRAVPPKSNRLIGGPLPAIK